MTFFEWCVCLFFLLQPCIHTLFGFELIRKYQNSIQQNFWWKQTDKLLPGDNSLSAEAWENRISALQCIISRSDTVCPLVQFPCVSIREEAKRLKDLEQADAIYSLSKILSKRVEMGINQGKKTKKDSSEVTLKFFKGYGEQEDWGELPTMAGSSEQPNITV